MFYFAHGADFSGRVSPWSLLIMGLPLFFGSDPLAVADLMAYRCRIREPSTTATATTITASGIQYWI
jgi:hypothetical protein